MNFSKFVYTKNPTEVYNTFTEVASSKVHFPSHTIKSAAVAYMHLLDYYSDADRGVLHIRHPSSRDNFARISNTEFLSVLRGTRGLQYTSSSGNLSDWYTLVEKRRAYCMEAALDPSGPVGGVYEDTSGLLDVMERYPFAHEILSQRQADITSEDVRVAVSAVCTRGRFSQDVAAKLFNHLRTRQLRIAGLDT